MTTSRFFARRYLLATTLAVTGCGLTPLFVSLSAQSSLENTTATPGERCQKLTSLTKSKIDACREAIRANSDDFVSVYILGEQLFAVFKDDSLEASIALWERSLAGNRTNYDSRYSLGYAYLRQYRFHMALSFAKELRSKSPSDPRVESLYQAAARRYIAFGPSIVPDSLLDSRVAMGLDFLAHSDWILRRHKLDSAYAEKALNLCLIARSSLPLTDVRSYTCAAAALIALERFHEARQVLDTALKMDSTAPSIFRWLSSTLFNLGHRDSIVIFSKGDAGSSRERLRERDLVITIKVPANATVKAQTGGSVTSLSAPTLSIMSESSDIKGAFMSAYYRARDGYPEDAILIMRQLVRVHPDSAKAWGRLAWINFDLKRYEEAAAAWTTAARLDPTYFDTLTAEKRDRDISLAKAGKDIQPMTVSDLARPLARPLLSRQSKATEPD